MAVVLEAESTLTDPVFGWFLAFWARDIEAHPERLEAVETELVRRIQSLVDGVDVDLEAVLLEGDE